MLAPTDPTITADWAPISARRWDKATAGVGHLALQQHRTYGEMIQRVGGTVKRAVIRDADGPLALAQVQERSVVGLFRLAMVMMGPVWLRQVSAEVQAAALAALAQSYPTTGRTAVLVMPAEDDVAALKLLRAPRMVSSYHTALLDLTPPLEELRAGLKGKWRNRLVAAEKSALTVRTMGDRPEAYQWLLDKETAQRKRQRYAAMPVEMVPAFQDVAGRSQILALAARLDGVDVAGCLFLIHGPTATYHIGWSSPDGRALNAHNLIQWTAMERLKGKGVKTLDLGGLTGDRSDGMVRFKLGTGARPISQAGTYLLKPRWR